MSGSYAIRTQLTLVFGAGVLVAFGIAMAFQPRVGDYLALALVLFLGFPHGADDMRLIRRLLSDRSSDRGQQRRASVAYLAAYVGVITLTLLIWWWQPSLGLATFLGLSIYHFGADHAAGLGLRGPLRFVYVLIWGSFVLLAPLCWHPGELTPVLTAMLGAPPPAQLVTWSSVVASHAAVGAVCFALGGYAVSRRREWLAEVALVGVLVGCYIALPSLWGFAFFFVCVHATTSMCNQLTWASEPVSARAVGVFLRRGAPYALLAVAGVLAGVSAVGVAPLSAGWYAGFFVLVSALTTPHVLVVDRAARQYATAELSSSQSPLV